MVRFKKKAIGQAFLDWPTSLGFVDHQLVYPALVQALVTILYLTHLSVSLFPSQENTFSNSAIPSFESYLRPTPQLTNHTQ